MKTDRKKIKHTIKDILNKLEAEEIRLVESGEPQEIAFQVAIASLTDIEVKIWHSYNFKEKFITKR